MKMKQIAGLLLLTVWVCAFVPALWAQEQGVVRGLVEDPNGDPLPEASVQLVPQTSHQPLSTVSNDAGRFVFTQVPLGKYVLRVKRHGFDTAEVEVKVDHSPTPDQRIRLNVGRNKEEITVSARTASDPLNGDQNANSTVLDRDLFKDLPTKMDDPLTITNLFIDPEANDSVGTKIVTDGVEADTLDVPKSSIKTVAVNTNPYSTEFGRPGRGRVEVITRGGSLRRFHKRLAFLFRDASLDARNHFATVSPPRRREWLEGELDGPLYGSKVTFFIGGDLLRDNDNEFVNAITPAGPVSDTAPVPRRTGHLFGRTDIRLSPTNVLSARYNWTVDRWANQGVGGFDLVGRGWTSNKRTQEVRIANTATPTASFLNQFAFDFRFRPKLYYSVTDAPAILVDGAFNAGGAQISKQDREKDIEFQDVASYIRGKHSLRFGVVVKSRFIDYTDSSNTGGTYSFSGLTNYINHSPYLYTVNRGDPRVTFTQDEIAFFVQDEIRLLPRLSLLVGARYELQSNLADYNNLAPRIALSAASADQRTVLRAGAGFFYQHQPVALTEQAVLLDGNHIQSFVLTNPSFPSPTVLPTSPLSVFRIDHRIRTPYNLQASLGVERRFGRATFLTADYTMIRGIKVYRLRDINAPLPSTGVRPNPNFVNMDQYSSSGTATATNLALGIRTNLRRLQLFSRYTFSHSIDDTSGLTFGTAAGSGSAGLSTAGSGGLSTAATTALPADNYNLRAERGRSDFDQRHRLVVGGVLKIPYGFNFGMVATARSGPPYTVITGFDNNGDTVANDRPRLGNPSAPFNSLGVDGMFVGGTAGVLYNGIEAVSGGPFVPVTASNVHWLSLPGAGNVGRNTLNGPSWGGVDMRLVKKFILKKAKDKTEITDEIELLFDAFNVFNKTNYRQYVDTLSSPIFGLPNTAYPARELQLGIRVSF